MSPVPALFLLLLLAPLASSSAPRSWNLLRLGRPASGTTPRLGLSVAQYCSAWRANVEVNNIRWFDVVPAECIGLVGSYLTGGQYSADVQRATEEATLYLTQSFALGNDGKDAWIFDVDEVLLSTVPFYQQHGNGAEKVDAAALEAWQAQGKALAVDHALCLYKQIVARGIKVFLISSRRESLRSATVDNLVAAGYHGWTRLILRSDQDLQKRIGQFMADERKKLVDQEGYRIWGVVSSQWGSLFGNPSPLRIFKFPNPLYYQS